VLLLLTVNKYLLKISEFYLHIRGPLIRIG